MENPNKIKALIKGRRLIKWEIVEGSMESGKFTFVLTFNGMIGKK